MTIDNEDSDYWKMKGDEYVKISQYDNAIHCYEYAVYLDPENRSALNNLGYSYSKIGRTDEAKRVRERIATIDKISEKERLAVVKEEQQREKKQALKHNSSYVSWAIIIAGIILVITVVPSLLLTKSPSPESPHSSFTEPTTAQPTLTSFAQPTVTSFAQPTLSVTPTNPTPIPRSVQILQDILTNYHNTHTYFGPNIYVCGDMACDVWNMVETQGINAIIRVGNVDTQVS
jgi:hypothetical protein